MNYVNGKIVSTEECDAILENIGEMILQTMRKPPIDVEAVIRACGRMTSNIGGLDIVKRLPELGINPAMARMYMDQIEYMFSEASIRKRMRIELGDDYDKPRTLTSIGGATAPAPSHTDTIVPALTPQSQAPTVAQTQSAIQIPTIPQALTATQTIAPLGVLFHITAGNVDGLPFVSLLDGLLTGNINIVKLPKEEGGITVSLLEELFAIEPTLKEYVYVFDYSSKDAHAMKTLAAVADAVVVWGGDDAVSAVRAMAAPNTKIIEWGHKISFAYVTKAGIYSTSECAGKNAGDSCSTESEYETINNETKVTNATALEKLARNICVTNQLLCSSCQGVYLDTSDMQDIYDFCVSFLPILENVSQAYPFAFDSAEKLFVQAKVTLDLYHQNIVNRNSAHRIFRGKDCSVTACPDSKLETSIMYRNIWVKPLPRESILSLRPYKGYLQTAALICAEGEYDELSRRLLQTGVVKVSDGYEMSNFAFGEAHDGMFPLRCYTRLVSVQDN